MRGLTARCKIGILIGESVRSVYCHKDAFPEIVGIMLRDCYDLESTNQLLNHGDLSYLGKNLDECNFYGRDRNVDKRECSARDYDTIDDFLSFGPVDYFYLLKDDGWYVKSSSYVDNYKVIPEFMTIDNSLLVKANYTKAEVKSPKW